MCAELVLQGTREQSQPRQCLRPTEEVRYELVRPRGQNAHWDRLVGRAGKEDQSICWGTSKPGALNGVGGGGKQ